MRDGVLASMGDTKERQQTQRAVAVLLAAAGTFALTMGARQSMGLFL